MSLLGLVIAMLAACFWPFDFLPRNRVAWLRAEQGIRCSGMAIVVSREAFPSPARLSTDGSITVEIAVRPSWVATRHVVHILTFFPAVGPPPLVVGAWKDSLIVRLGRPNASGREKYRELGVGGAFTVGKTTLVTVTTGPRGTAVYLNGRLATVAPDAQPGDTDSPLGRLVLGVSPTGGGRWQGDILGLTISSRALSGEDVQLNHDAMIRQYSPPSRARDSIVADYAFDEGSGENIHAAGASRYDLRIPAHFQPLRRTALAPPSWDTHGLLWNLEDNVLNTLGFIPFGIVASWLLSALTRIGDRAKASTVVFAGCALSLTIEIVQAFLPHRTSSLVDLLTNTAGTALGVLCFFLVSQALAWLDA